MWVAEFEGKVISAMICIYHEDHVFDWLAASIINEDLKKLYAPVAVQFEVIRHAAENGLNYVNMGASVNLSGVSDFKDSWGASEHETFTFNKQSALFKVSKKIINNIKKIRP
jgi:lipid II:glycine glycyltransferase (peptidoglycan interpeptide bridge formation enzyme)